MKRQLPPPPPCVVIKYGDNGEVIANYTVTRDPIREAGWEGERVPRRFVVLAEQETGEDHHVGFAATRRQADEMCDAHMNSHPEHRRCWFEHL